MSDVWPVYVITVRARVKTDMLNHALRAWLKLGLRKFGFECIGLATSSKRESEIMDMRGYAAKYIKPDHVREGSMRLRIVRVFEDDRYGRPMLELENGSEFTLNDGNVNALIKPFGFESNDWVGQEIELALGFYKDWKSDPPVDKETVKVRAVSPQPKAEGNGGEPSKALPPSRVGVGGGHASLRGEMDDEIPFACEWR